MFRGWSKYWLYAIALAVVCAAPFASASFRSTIYAGPGGPVSSDLDLAGNHITDSTGVTQVGDACTTAHAGGVGDVCIEGLAEVHGVAYFDGPSVFLPPTVNIPASPGGGTNAMQLSLGSGKGYMALVRNGVSARNIIFGDFLNRDKSASLGFAEETDPGYFFTSGALWDADALSYLKLQHNRTDATVTVGKGHFSVTPATGKALKVTTGLLALTETTAPTPIAGVAQLFATTADLLRMTTDGGTFTIGGAVPGFQNYTHPTTTSGTQYLAGFYDMPAADANLDEGSTTVTHGLATNGYGAHAGLVAGGAGTVDAGTVSIVVSGTSFDPSTGTRTTSDSEVLVADITTLVINQKVETTKVWLGVVTYTLTPAGASTFSVDFNYGWMSYADFGDRDFTITDVAANYHGAANETDLDIIVYHHDVNNWAYHATAFVPGGTVIVSRSTDYATDAAVSNGEIGKYKRTGLSTLVDGADSEGYVIRLDTDVNNSIHHINIAIGANF